MKRHATFPFFVIEDVVPFHRGPRCSSEEKHEAKLVRLIGYETDQAYVCTEAPEAWGHYVGRRFHKEKGYARGAWGHAFRSPSEAIDETRDKIEKGLGNAEESVSCHKQVL